jgi:endoglucanase
LTTYLKEEEKKWFLDRLGGLSGAVGVTGDEYGASAIAETLLAPYADETRIDARGNVTGLVRSGLAGAPVWVFDAHIDQVGIQITHIAPEGYLGFTEIGLDARILPGQVFVVAAHSGERIPAVVVLPKDAHAPDVLPTYLLLLDTGMPEDAVKEKIRVGDFAAFAGDAHEIAPGRICGPALDDRACFLSILAFARRLKRSGRKPAADIVFSATVREEIGGPGAAAVAVRYKPSLFVAVDVCHVKPGSKENGERFEGGPAIAIRGDSDDFVSARLLETARAKDIPHGTYGISYVSGTNAGEVRIVGCGVRCAVVSLPLLYMHTPNEIVSLQDIAWTGELLYHFAVGFQDGERG